MATHSVDVIAAATTPADQLRARALEKFLRGGSTYCSLTELRAIPRARLTLAARRRLDDAIQHRERSMQ